MRKLSMALLAIVALVGCGVDLEAKNQEIVSNLIEAGFPADDIMIHEEAVYVGRDAHVTLEASREMLQTTGSEEQYRTNNLVGTAVTKICVNPTSAFNSYTRLSQGLDLAIANYNEKGLRLTFARGPTTGCTANITAQTTSGTGGSAGFPSGGLPYGIINIGTGLDSYSVDVNEHVITHELGHAIGFRHSDYYDRSISCGWGSNEGDAGVGAIHIPGTPTTATLGGSIMNSCFSSTETGEWTSSDMTALDYLYGNPKFTFVSNAAQVYTNKVILTATFKNTGGAASTITGVGFVDPFGRVTLGTTSTCTNGSSLAAGASCTVVLHALRDCVNYTTAATLSNAAGTTTGQSYTVNQTGYVCP